MSPKLRVNAQPGYEAPLRKTRGGSSAASMDSSPKSSLSGVSPRIIPSVAKSTGSLASFRMRSRSSRLKHVWSCVTSTMSQAPALPSSPVRAVPRMALESPTLPMWSMSHTMCATTAVVPLLLHASPRFFWTTRSVSTNARAYAVARASRGTGADRSPCDSSSGSRRCFSSSRGKVAAAICAACSPAPPCPSNTPMSTCSRSPANPVSRMNVSWLTCAFLSG